MAVRKMADAMSQPGKVFSGDEDPELVGEALPFALKMMETLRESAPDHVEIHVGLASGFVQYAYAYVLWPAEQMEVTSYAAAQEPKKRAHRLFLRAHRYATQAMELAHPGFAAAFAKDPAGSMAGMQIQDVPKLYWLAASLAMAIRTEPMNTELLVRLTEAGRLLERALELDPNWGNGDLDEALISYYAAVGEGLGGGEAKAKARYDHALSLTRGERPSLYLSWAEAFLVGKQDRKGFEELCRKALAVDTEKDSEHKLAAVLAQRRARWLLARSDELFLE